MSAPPKDVPASELFRKLSAAQPASEVYPFPRKDEEGNPVDHIRITVLKSEEIDSARERAVKYFSRDRKMSSEEMGNPVMRGSLSDRTAYELLVMSCHTAKAQIEDESGRPIYGKIFHSPDDVRKVLTAQEVETLYNMYQLVQDKFGPREHNTDVDLWVSRLAEGGQHYPLLSLDLPELVSLTCSLADRISTISDALGSQLEALPDSCRSVLARFCLDTSLLTSPQSDSETSSTTENSDIEDALRLGERLRKSEALLDATDPPLDD